MKYLALQELNPQSLSREVIAIEVEKDIYLYNRGLLFGRLVPTEENISYAYNLTLVRNTMLIGQERLFSTLKDYSIGKIKYVENELD